MATQTCDRTVTGRNFDYNSALSIIQGEDYLEDEDFDDIRLFRKQGEVIQALESFEEKLSDDLGIRDKREAPYGRANQRKLLTFDEIEEFDHEYELIESFDEDHNGQARLFFVNFTSNIFLFDTCHFSRRRTF